MTPETRAASSDTTDVYYFVSDLHVGGDEPLQQVDFRDELLAFLENLEESDEDAELMINGDAFGRSEFTEVEGPAKVDALLDRCAERFEQLEVTGREIPITLVPGSHDYELAAYPEYVERLAEYNVPREQVESLLGLFYAAYSLVGAALSYRTGTVRAHVGSRVARRRRGALVGMSPVPLLALPTSLLARGLAA